MEKTDHLIALRVMSLTKPPIAQSTIVTAEPQDIPGNAFINELKKGVTSAPGIETLNAGQFLLAPQSFEKVYLGQTFSSLICGYNETRDIIKDVSIKIELETQSQKISLSDEKRVSDLAPDMIVTTVINHQVTELGTHALICEVNYQTPLMIPVMFKKFYQFCVMKPLDIKTKFYNVENGDIFLEAQVENITSAPMCLEKVTFDSSAMFSVNALNSTKNGSVFGEITQIEPNSCCQFLYGLKLDDKYKFSPTIDSMNIGKLAIAWRSNTGERGRLETSELRRMPTSFQEVRVVVKELPNVVYLDECFSITVEIIYTKNKSNLTLELQSNASNGLVWFGQSRHKVEDGEDIENMLRKEFKLDLLAVKSGMLNVSGIKLIDATSKMTHEFDYIAQVFATAPKNHVEYR